MVLTLYVNLPCSVCLLEPKEQRFTKPKAIQANKIRQLEDVEKDSKDLICLTMNLANYKISEISV